MAYDDFKYLIKRTTFDKALYNKAFEIDSNPEYGGYQCELYLIVYKSFLQKTWWCL